LAPRDRFRFCRTERAEPDPTSLPIPPRYPQFASAYRTSLRLAQELGARTITFPAISTGVYGYPIESAARVSATTVRDHLAGETTLEPNAQGSRMDGRPSSTEVEPH
jgi:hypothetical protein